MMYFFWSTKSIFSRKILYDYLYEIYKRIFKLLKFSLKNLFQRIQNEGKIFGIIFIGEIVIQESFDLREMIVGQRERDYKRRRKIYCVTFYERSNFSHLNDSWLVKSENSCIGVLIIRKMTQMEWNAENFHGNFSYSEKWFLKYVILYIFILDRDDNYGER